MTSFICAANRGAALSEILKRWRNQGGRRLRRGEGERRVPAWGKGTSPPCWQGMVVFPCKGKGKGKGSICGAGVDSRRLICLHLHLHTHDWRRGEVGPLRDP